MSILQHVLDEVPLRKTQRNFLIALLNVVLAVPRRLNALNLSRYSLGYKSSKEVAEPRPGGSFPPGKVLDCLSEGVQSTAE